MPLFGRLPTPTPCSSSHKQSLGIIYIQASRGSASTTLLIIILDVCPSFYISHTPVMPNHLSANMARPIGGCKSPIPCAPTLAHDARLHRNPKSSIILHAPIFHGIAQSRLGSVSHHQGSVTKTPPYQKPKA